MAAFYRSFHDWFWAESFWLPGNTTWAEVHARKNLRVVQAGELYLCLPIAVALIVLRVAFERLIASPFVQSLGVKDKKINFTPNPFCEKVYQTINKFPPSDRILGLSKQIGWTTREVERWFRHRRMQSKPSLLKKAKESSWRFVFYTGATIYGFCILYKEKWLWDTDHCFIGYHGHVMSEELYIYYVVELGFYVSLTISQFVDVQRKDFWQMLIHHIVTILLLSFSYAAAFFRIGAVIVLVHDVSDVFLEAAKVANYAKLRQLCDCLFVLFAISFFVARLFIYPVWVLASVYRANELAEPFNSWITFMTLLIMLQILHIFWGWSIIVVVYRLSHGKDAKDVRSDEESSAVEDEEKAKRDGNPPENKKHQ
ncbi:ceramide synthase 6 isoform X2 [Nematostella vectensis]|uniref:ceramide synthase 6 isoform X2 n=1 Tax=Nematostella vectensis TaxID=45351 RepID=UPI0020777629|nr:ceramide synthase 6 isoform X2 [Nematostella vectensis]